MIDRGDVGRHSFSRANRQSLQWNQTTSRRQQIPRYSNSLSIAATRMRKCETCGKWFSNVDDMRRHISLTHTGCLFCLFCSVLFVLLCFSVLFVLFVLFCLFCLFVLFFCLFVLFVCSVFLFCFVCSVCSGVFFCSVLFVLFFLFFFLD